MIVINETKKELKNIMLFIIYNIPSYSLAETNCFLFLVSTSLKKKLFLKNIFLYIFSLNHVLTNGGLPKILLDLYMWTSVALTPGGCRWREISPSD